MPERVRVLVHVDGPTAGKIAAAVPEVEVCAVARSGPLDPDVRGAVLLTLPWGSENLADVLARGVGWVHAMGTGVDRFPFELLGDQTLTCSRGAHSRHIAEYALAALLAFEKQLPGVWLDAAPEHWYAAELGTLEGRIVGIIGAGSIATALSEMLTPLNARVLAFRRRAQQSPHHNMEVIDSLRRVVEMCDHLVVAAPATPATHHIVDAELLSHCKPGLHLVNIARGSLVDLDALRAALDSGRVAAATLDVVDPEPLPGEHWIYDDPRVRLSPHVSWTAPGAVELILDAFIANLHRFVAGEPLANVVDIEAGY